jgi:hypothetical protein
MSAKFPIVVGEKGFFDKHYQDFVSDTSNFRPQEGECRTFHIQETGRGTYDALEDVEIESENVLEWIQKVV